MRQKVMINCCTHYAKNQCCRNNCAFNKQQQNRGFSCLPTMNLFFPSTITDIVIYKSFSWYYKSSIFLKLDSDENFCQYKWVDAAATCCKPQESVLSDKLYNFSHIFLKYELTTVCHPFIYGHKLQKHSILPVKHSQIFLEISRDMNSSVTHSSTF